MMHEDDASYMEQLARAICDESGDDWDKEDHALYLGYAVLARTKGAATTSEDVHDAWAAWAIQAYPFLHHSAIPFDQLSPEVQAYDDVYRDAIRRVAVKQ